MVPFGEHLGADQNARLTALNGGEQLVHCVFARGAVAVDPQHGEVREQNTQALFCTLGARTHGAQVDLAARRAMTWDALDMAAMVAAQFAGTLVHSHARVAARAFREPAAVVAKQGRRKAATVEEHQDLLACSQSLSDGLLHRSGNTAVQWPALHIQPQEARLLRTACALVQAQQAVASGVGVVQAFQ